ncbi:MAG: GntR family transcriptional regulator [Calditrichia bacterium]
MGIDLNSRTPLYIQIADEIKSQIESGKYKPGDQISSQSELAELYSVSLITVKKAIAELVNEGVLFARMGKGTFVAEKANRVNFSEHPTIGLVLGDLNSPYFSRIMESVEKQVSENGCNLMLSNSYESQEKEEKQITHFLNIGVSGLIIASMTRSYHASEIVKHLHETNFPYVIVSYMADENINFVGTDHELGAYVATEHLIKLGYDKIGYINSEDGNILGEVRKTGYRRALKEFNKNYSKEYEFRVREGGGWNYYRSGYEIGQQFNALEALPDAMFTYNDLIALGFERAILESGRQIPGDIAIVGFDNIKRGMVAPVPLTTIHQPTDKIGYHAVKLLLDKINKKTGSNRIILKPELIVRASCGSGLFNNISYGDEMFYDPETSGF